MLNCWLKRPDFDHNVSSLFSDVQTIFIVGLVYYGIYTFASLFMTYGSCTVSKWHMSTHSCSLFHAHSFWFCIPCLSLFSLSLFFIPCSSILILYSMLLLFFSFIPCSSILILIICLPILIFYSMLTYFHILFHAHLFLFSIPCLPIFYFLFHAHLFLLSIPWSPIIIVYPMLTYFFLFLYCFYQTFFISRSSANHKNLCSCDNLLSLNIILELT